MAVRIQMRRGTTSDWNTADPILNEGEIGYNTTLGQIKIGDGSSVWSALDYMATDAQLNSSLADYIELIEKGAADGVAELDSNKNVLTRESVIFEGATTNSYQTTVTVVDPTEDRTITLPNSTGTVVIADVSGNVIISGNLTVNGTTTTIDTQNLVVEDKNITIGDVGTPTDITADGGGITLKGTTDKTFNWVDATDSWTSSENINLASGKTYFKNGTDIKDVTETFTNKTISGTSNTITNVANTSLVNSSITINGTPISLGGSVNLPGDIESVAAGTGLTGGGTSGAVTLSVDTTVVATTNNTLTMSGKTLTSPVVSGLALSDSSIVFEGSSADENETTLTVTNPTADRTITLPDVSGTVVTTGDTGSITSTMIADGTIVNADINASASIDKTKIAGTAITAADTGTVTSTMIADGTIVDGDINASANIAVSKLAASTISGVTLGNNLNALTIGTGLSGTSYNGSAAVTVAIDSTVATTSGSQTLTNKTIALGNNTISGTTAQFNTALTDGDFATLAGSETLTNKTLGSTTALGANLNAATFKITSLGTPNASTDAATKQYVDDLAQGLHIHASVVAATTSNLTATYANGSSGVGATLTNSGTQAALVIDGVTLSTNDRVLVKNQSTQLQNGIYTVTDTGSVSTNWVLTRATDMDESLEVDGGDFVFVTGGTSGDNTGWVQTETGVTVGTSNIIFTQFSGAGTYLAGNGLTLTGNTFSINTGTTVDLSTAQTLTNKTINGANNTLTVRLANDITGFGTGVATALAVNTESAGAPVLFNGALGTPSSGTLTNATGLPVTSGISGLGTGVATFLATPSSANLIAAVTDETGTGSLVFATSPTLTTPNLGTPSALTLTNATGLPVTSGISGMGTGVATFLATPSSANLASAVTDETGSGSLVFGTAPSFTTAITLNATGELRLADTDSSHYVGFKAPETVSTNRIWTLPSTDGTSGQTLSTNGSGTLSWSTPASGAAFSELMLVGC